MTHQLRGDDARVVCKHFVASVGTSKRKPGHKLGNRLRKDIVGEGPKNPPMHLPIPAPLRARRWLLPTSRGNSGAKPDDIRHERNIRWPFKFKSPHRATHRILVVRVRRQRRTLNSTAPRASSMARTNFQVFSRRAARHLSTLDKSIRTTISRRPTKYATRSSPVVSTPRMMRRPRTSRYGSSATKTFLRTAPWRVVLPTAVVRAARCRASLASRKRPRCRGTQRLRRQQKRLSASVRRALRGASGGLPRPCRSHSPNSKE